MVRGSLTLIPGNMFAGKSEFLIVDMIPRLQEHANKKVLVIKPEKDTRSGVGKIKTKPGKRMEERTMDAIEAPSDDMGRMLTMIQHEEEKIASRFDVLAFDEVQFFDEKGFYRLVKQLLRDGYDVIAAGLERDFRNEPFGPMSYLKLLVDDQQSVINLDSRTYCRKCGKPNAHYPQRLVDGEPARYDSAQVVVGGAEAYEPRCGVCHEVPGEPRILPN